VACGANDNPTYAEVLTHLDHERAVPIGSDMRDNRAHSTPRAERDAPRKFCTCRSGRETIKIYSLFSSLLLCGRGHLGALSLLAGNVNMLKLSLYFKEIARRGQGEFANVLLLMELDAPGVPSEEGLQLTAWVHSHFTD